MSKPTFAERCLLAEQCLPDAPYRAMLKKLHTEILDALAAREWVGLTDEEIAELMMQTWGCASIAPRHAPAFARAIEAKLREKNSGETK